MMERHSMHKITAYQTLRPTRFPLIFSLSLHQVHADTRHPPLLLLTLELAATLNQPAELLRMEFLNVQQLTLNHSTSLLHITQLEISTLDKQWETLRYMVFDAEQDATLKFLCSDFNAVISSN